MCYMRGHKSCLVRDLLRKKQKLQGLELKATISYLAGLGGDKTVAPQYIRYWPFYLLAVGFGCFLLLISWFDTMLKSMIIHS